MFRGREQSRPELGFRLLQRLAGDVEELGFVESQPKQDGRNMIMVIGPHKKKSEAKAHAGQSHSKSVPSPRPAAPAAPGEPCGASRSGQEPRGASRSGEQSRDSGARACGERARRRQRHGTGSGLAGSGTRPD